jgi:hypothetical protein
LGAFLDVLETVLAVIRRVVVKGGNFDQKKYADFKSERGGDIITMNFFKHSNRHGFLSNLGLIQGEKLGVKGS